MRRCMYKFVRNSILAGRAHISFVLLCTITNRATPKSNIWGGGAYLHFTEVNGFKQFTEAWISNLFLYCFYVTNKPNRIAFWDGVARSHPLHFWESIHLITFLGKRCMVYLMSENHNCHSYLGLKSEVCHVRFEERQNRNNVEKELSASNTVRIMNFKWAMVIAVTNAI